MRTALLLLPSLALCASCLRTTEFRCMTNEQCSPGGTCESVGYCSFPDSECGRRFSDSAGPYAGTCVEDTTNPNPDAAIDAMNPPIDSPMVGCPADYMPLTGGTTGHVYKKTPTNLLWAGQFDACRNTSGMRAYLAVPNDATELMALHTAAGGAVFWVGISDRADEGVFIEVATSTVFPSNSPLWATGQPDNQGGGGGQDCVAGTDTTLSDEDCTGNGATARPAVCECVMP